MAKITKYAKNVLKCPMILGPIVQWLKNALSDSAVSNYPMMGQLSVQLSHNGQHCVFVEIYALFIGQIWFGKSRYGTVSKLCDPWFCEVII